VLGSVEAGWVDRHVDTRPASFAEADLRRANRGGARISAAEIASILERRRAIERALRAIAPDASLAGAASAVPWPALARLFEPFAGLRGVGLAKTTKALYPKRPALVPLLDSVVQRYLADDDPGAGAPFAERALALVRGYKRDLDRNRAPIRAVRRALAARGHALTEVRILDLLIWSCHTAPMAATVGFAQDIRPLFRERDIASMSSHFDLSSYDDVRAHADPIYARLADGSMPCDTSWPRDRVERFRAWIDGGFAP